MEWDELQSAGTVMGGRHEMVGLAMGLCLAPHNTISPQSWWKRAGTGWVSHLRPHKQRQGPCARELGVTRLKPPHRGGLVPCLALSFQSRQTVHPISISSGVHGHLGNRSSPKEEVGDGKGDKAFSFTFSCRQTQMHLQVHQ